VRPGAARPAGVRGEKSSHQGRAASRAPGIGVIAARLGGSVNGDIELEIGAGSAAGTYEVRVIRAAAGGEPTANLQLDVEQLLGRRGLLEATLLASAVARRSGPAAEQPVREVGQQLFQALFSGPVYGMYRASLGVAQQRGGRLRVVLRLTAPELAALPWETLFDPETGTYLCRHEPLVRHVPAPYTTDPVDVRPPLRILGLVASPRGLPPLDVEAEKEHLAEALAEPVAQGLVEVVWVPEATWEAVHARLLSGEWHVLHFVGHGDYDTRTDEGVLALVGADGRADLVEAGRLADLLGEAQPTPQLVVLNSCSSGQAGVNDLFSGTAATLARCGISAVAAMQFTISDTAAIAFSRGFYSAIAQGRDVDEAARSGRISILGMPRSLEWVTPVLYVRGQARRLFTLTAPPAARSQEPPPSQTSSGNGSPVIMPPHDAGAQGPATTPAPAGRARPRLTRRRLAVIGAVAVVIAAGALVGILLRSLSSHSGKAPAWPSALGGSVYRRPFVTNGTVYAGDSNGHVYALDATAGRRVWAYPRGGHLAPVISRPIVAGGIVYFGTQEGSVYAVDTRTGALRWHVRTGAPVRSNLVYLKGVLYFGSGNNAFVALNANDGSRYWQPVPLAGVFEHSPAIYTNEMSAAPLQDRTIYIGAGGLLYALNAATGKPDWKRPVRIGSGDGSIPAVSPDGKTVYVGGGGHAIYALNAHTGSPRWKQPFRLRAPVQNQPAASNGVVYFASGDYVFAVNADKTSYWRPHNLGAPVTGVIVANGSVYAGAGDYMYCLDASTGRQCQGWHPYRAGGQVTGPVLYNGMIYFGALDGKVYALTPHGFLARPAG
jgi:outer membrane protein assembly factor BamB